MLAFQLVSHKTYALLNCKPDPGSVILLHLHDTMMSFKCKNKQFVPEGNCFHTVRKYNGNLAPLYMLLS